MPWFAHPAIPRQGAIRPFARTAVRIQLLAPPLYLPKGGLSDTAAGTIAYVTIIPAIIFLAMEPYNRSSFVRFHSWQSIFLGVAAFAVHLILAVIPIVGWLLMVPVGLGFLVLWILVIFKASKGERYKLPFIGNFAEQQAR